MQVKLTNCSTNASMSPRSRSVMTNARRGVLTEGTVSNRSMFIGVLTADGSDVTQPSTDGGISRVECQLFLDMTSRRRATRHNDHIQSTRVSHDKLTTRHPPSWHGTQLVILYRSHDCRTYHLQDSHRQRVRFQKISVHRFWQSDRE